MAIKLRCPNPDCGRVLRVPDERAGQTGACPVCGVAIRVPLVSEPLATETEPPETAKPLPRMTTSRPAPDLPPPGGDAGAVRPFLLAGAIGLGAYVLSVILPWQSASIRGGGPFGPTAASGPSVLGINCATGVGGLVLCAAALGFMAWAWSQRRDLLTLASWVGAGCAAFAFLLAIGQVLRGAQAGSSSGLAAALKIEVEVRTEFGLYLALLSSLAAALSFGVVALGLHHKIPLGRSAEPPAKAPSGVSGLTTGRPARRIPRAAWGALAGLVILLGGGGGIAWWLLAPRVHLENLPKVRAGMTEAEVENLLGPGEVVSTQTIPGGFNPFSKGGKSSVSKTVRWKAEKDGATQEVTLSFIDGKVMMGFGPKDDAPVAGEAQSLADAFKDLAKSMKPPTSKDSPKDSPDAPGAKEARQAPARSRRPAQAAASWPPAPGGMPGEVADLDGALKALSRVGFERFRALDWLVAAAPVAERRDEVLAALQAILDGQDPTARPKAAAAFAAWATPEQTPALIRVLDDPDEGVRRAAIGALGRLRDARAAEPLARRLAVPADRGAAGRALAALGAEAAEAVRPLLQSEDRAVRAEAANVLRAIGSLKGDSGLTLALADLKDPDNGVRVRALRELARARPGPGDPRRAETAATLVALLDDREPSIRVEAARALVAWATPESADALLNLLGSDSADLRHAAMDALARLGDKRAVPMIARHLLDGDRSHATRALQTLGPAAEPEVVRYLQHRDGAVRVAACRVLQVAGTRKSISALRMTTADRNREVARAALDALDGIARRKSAQR
jgi:HEAT repeat protein